MKDIRDLIEKWYENRWRKGINKYPWRIGKKTTYEILVAELLLQHTTAKAILNNSSYTIFLEKFPDIFSLNDATKEELIQIFRPIGLYNQKTDRIKKLAKTVIENYDGQIPKKKSELIKIPGIGEYITNAILTFAFDKNEVPLDNNLKRIALNVWNFKKKKELISFYKNLAEPNPKKIYWAFFDIGRFHCRKPRPNCLNCPLMKNCKAKNAIN